jgi:hypothetical protein
VNTRRAIFKQADAARALRAAVSAGLRPSAYTIGIDGSITVNLGDDQPDDRNSFDEIMRPAK